MNLPNIKRYLVSGKKSISESLFPKKTHMGKMGRRELEKLKGLNQDFVTMQM